ncbi:MAG: N-6 DNA methylase [Cyanobacteria bacterium HKST-UBA02]|nr:N-6 DNA methylase [Cyanobacteria bacterium HKST-UBA02]
MGRHAKSVLLIEKESIDRREKGYYSTPSFIADYLTGALLSRNPHGKTALDPCAGKEELTGGLIDAGVTVDSFDIHDYGWRHRSSFRKQDFLEFYIAKKGRQLDYDFYIANPPYNCHETSYIRERRQELRRAFPDTGAGNMYSMFLAAMIDLAKDGAFIAAITFDSFLTGGTHQGLREKILEQCSLHELILCPRDLFLKQKAEVRTCLLVLQKGKNYQGAVCIADRPRDTGTFEKQLENKRMASVSLASIVLERDRKQLLPGCPAEIFDLFQNPRLGDVFSCITGISTGNDRLYLSAERKPGFSIPFYKNPGSRKFFTEPDGYLPDDFLTIEKQVPNFMVRNKALLFKEGITCSSMGIPFSACYLPAGATYGVNPNIIAPPADIWWLIAYLNSSLVTFIVRAVLLRTNMITSGYVSRIPLIELSAAQKRRLEDLARSGFDAGPDPTDTIERIESIDSIVFDAAGLSPATIARVRAFCRDPLSLT